MSVTRITPRAAEGGPAATGRRARRRAEAAPSLSEPPAAAEPHSPRDGSVRTMAETHRFARRTYRLCGGRPPRRAVGVGPIVWRLAGGADRFAEPRRPLDPECLASRSVMCQERADRRLCNRLLQATMASPSFRICRGSRVASRDRRDPSRTTRGDLAEGSSTRRRLLLLARLECGD